MWLSTRSSGHICRRRNSAKRAGRHAGRKSCEVHCLLQTRETAGERGAAVSGLVGGARRRHTHGSTMAVASSCDYGNGRCGPESVRRRFIWSRRRGPSCSFGDEKGRPLQQCSKGTLPTCWNRRVQVRRRMRRCPTRPLKLTSTSLPSVGLAARSLTAARWTDGMRIETDDAEVSWTQVAALFAAVGWGARSPNDIRAAFSRSTFKAFAYDGDELVGFGRTIDDGKFYASPRSLRNDTIRLPLASSPFLR